jgi:hypothetical protein
LLKPARKKLEIAAYMPWAKASQRRAGYCAAITATTVALALVPVRTFFSWDERKPGCGIYADAGLLQGRMCVLAGRRSALCSITPIAGRKRVSPTSVPRYLFRFTVGNA